MIIGERIHMLRSEKDLSMKQLGNILGLSDGAINKYEKNKAEPSLEVFQKMVDYFDVSADFLLGRTNIRNQKTIQDANVQSELLREFETAQIGDTSEMDSFITNFSEVIHTYKAEKATNLEFKTLLQIINEVVITFNDLISLKNHKEKFDTEILRYYQKSIANITSGQNELLNQIFAEQLSSQKGR